MVHKVGRKDSVAPTPPATASTIDQNYFENFSCKPERNYTGYCNPEIEKLMEKHRR
jgi:hypothetical protein